MKLRKIDIIIIVIILLFAGISYFAINSLYGKKGGKVEILIDGKVDRTFSLKDNRRYEINNKYGFNEIVINDEKVEIIEADCKDELCVKQGSIDKNGQSIICLPHHLVIKIISDKDADVDAVAN